MPGGFGAAQMELARMANYHERLNAIWAVLEAADETLDVREIEAILRLDGITTSPETVQDDLENLYEKQGRAECVAGRWSAIKPRHGGRK